MRKARRASKVSRPLILPARTEFPNVGFFVRGDQKNFIPVRQAVDQFAHQNFRAAELFDRIFNAQGDFHSVLSWFRAPDLKAPALQQAEPPEVTQEKALKILEGEFPGVNPRAGWFRIGQEPVSPPENCFRSGLRITDGHDFPVFARLNVIVGAAVGGQDPLKRQAAGRGFKRGADQPFLRATAGQTSPRSADVPRSSLYAARRAPNQSEGPGTAQAAPRTSSWMTRVSSRRAEGWRRRTIWNASSLM